MSVLHLHAEKINGHIPDNQFRSRDPKFQTQKEKRSSGDTILN